MSNKNNKKNKRKERYSNLQQSSRKAEELHSGIKGFMITCEANREKRCIKECFNLLNHALEVVQPDVLEKAKDLIQKHNDEIQKKRE